MQGNIISSPEDLLCKGIPYHNKCYASATHKNMIDRAKFRHEKGKKYF